ncbi:MULTISPECIES: hypothetical protein [unclassified Brevibacterium]|uniref:hypothetical protein n=1 Tax=unclassified Brevibacterium TaxID=2614124 RepID=UPI0008A1BF94|nr:MULTISPECIES: hypothetical protein [unclassified Brevibacterium]OFL68807.1 hypothetical protein HMPREF2757_07840 [Brevibacterium sp. HMSC063G07]OFS25572.1 hypothetical protein HMPREF3162_08320 [Brevibacterium sp. HMSC07C04]
MTTLLKMSNSIQDRVEALQARAGEKGAVSIEYLAIALVVVVVLTIAIAAANGASGTLGDKFKEAVENIFSAG